MKKIHLLGARKDAGKRLKIKPIFWGFFQSMVFRLGGATKFYFSC